VTGSTNTIGIIITNWIHYRPPSVVYLYPVACCWKGPVICTNILSNRKALQPTIITNNYSILERLLPPLK
jgi:hypothetical protein